jgi:hypothetical protein
LLARSGGQTTSDKSGAASATEAVNSLTKLMNWFYKNKRAFCYFGKYLFLSKQLNVQGSNLKNNLPSLGCQILPHRFKDCI